MNWDHAKTAHLPFLAQLDAQERSMEMQRELYQPYVNYGVSMLGWMNSATTPIRRAINSTCNCRNYGAPFEPTETSCSSCRSSR